MRVCAHRGGGGRASRGGRRGRYAHRDSNSYTNDWTCLHEGIRRCPRRVHAISRGCACPRVHASSGILAPLIPRSAGTGAMRRRRRLVAQFSRRSKEASLHLAFRRGNSHTSTQPLTSCVPSVCIFNAITPGEFLEIGLIMGTDIFGLSRRTKLTGATGKRIRGKYVTCSFKVILRRGVKYSYITYVKSSYEFSWRNIHGGRLFHN